MLQTTATGQKLMPSSCQVLLQGVKHGFVALWDKTNVIRMENAFVLLSPQLTEARQGESKIKVVLIKFFDTQGLGASLNAFWSLVHELDCLLNCSVMPWKCSSWVMAWKMVWCYLTLQHNNASCLLSLSIREFLAKQSFQLVPIVPYAPNLDPCNSSSSSAFSSSSCLPRLKITLREMVARHYGDTTE